MTKQSTLWTMLKRQISTSSGRVGLQSVAKGPNHGAKDTIFTFTRGRFVQNEKFEMSLRQVRFNMNELSKIAANAMGFPFCTKVERYSDGMYNKSFLFTMQDGSQVVGKIPNPNAGRPYFTTASEVATMDFLRNVLHTPAPKIYSWSSNAENLVRSEYIIMEKISGIQLDQVWPTMNINDKFAVVKSLNRYQKSWLSASFPYVGALYFAQDIEKGSCLDCEYQNHDEERIKDPGYVIGPCTGRDFSDDGRSSLVFDRGPWRSAEDYKTAVGNREITCVKNLAHLPKSPLTLWGPGAYIPTRERKVAALENYLKLVKFVLPTDNSMLRSHLWHCDLHSENVYVNPDNPCEVVGLIDWQSTDILPLFDQARQPYFLDYVGPRLSGLERAVLPDNYAELSPEEQQQAMTLYLQMSLAALYRRLIHDRHNSLYRAMEFRETISFELLVLAQNLLVDGEAQYQALVAEFQSTDRWAELPGVRAHGSPSFPCHFSPDELTAVSKDAAAAIRGMNYMDQIKQTVGGDLWPERGVVRPDQYEDSKAALKAAKLQLFDQLELDEQQRAEWDLAWPFDD